jgi:hypothetical protein
MKKLIPLLMLLIAAPALAERQFDIEVIFFKRAVNAEQTAESWPNNLTEIDLKRTGALTNASYLDSKGVTILPYSEYGLNEEVQRLKQHAGFDVLLHTAWRQGDGNRHVAPTFHIQAGQDFSTRFNQDGSMVGSEEKSEEVLAGITEESIAKPLYELDGKFQIYVEHYLYADVEMDLKAPSVRSVTLVEKPVEALSQPQAEVIEPLQLDSNNVVEVGFMEDVTPTVITEEFLKNYRIKQKRRMRSTETHYLDHPLMGVIIQVRRVASNPA